MVEKSVVAKHNKLIEARYSLNLNEQKIILYAVSQLDHKKQKDFNTIEFTVEEFTRLIGTTKDRYIEIKKIIKNLMKKPVEIKLEDGELVANWVSSLKYVKGEGKIILEFSSQLKPYLLELGEKYKYYQLKNVINFKNKYAIRIYELLKQVERMNPRERKIPLGELREMLGVEKSKYQLFSNFDKFVLKPSKSELLKHSDICFEYEKIKDGKNIVAIKFKVEKNHSNIKNEEDLLYTEDEIQNIKRNSDLSDTKFNNKQIIELYEIAVRKVGDREISPYHYIRLNYEYSKSRSSEKGLYKYLKGALEEDYAKALLQITFGDLLEG